MFDKYVTKNMSEQHEHTHIEKRAPTDESIRLLREMETAAKKEVISSIQLPSNELRGVIHHSKDVLSCATRIAIIFELNGKKHCVNVSLDDYLDRKSDDKARKIVEKTSLYIACEILSKIFDHVSVREILK